MDWCVLLLSNMRLYTARRLRLINHGLVRVFLGVRVECGVGVTCVVAKWFLEHGIAKELLEGLAPFLRGQPEAVASFYEQLKLYVSIAAALVSGSFAIWKWYHFREAVLHRRLKEYLNESDIRLEPTLRDVVSLIKRPDRRTPHRQPAFALELRSVLKRNSWDRAIMGVDAKVTSDRELTRIASRINSRIGTAELALVSLRRQLVAADIIAATLAAARAAKVRDRVTAKRYDEEALRLYSGVESVPGHQRDLIALEGKAYHLLRLGQRQLALTEFVRLENCAADIENARDRVFVASRAKRYQALISQAVAPPDTGAGWALVSPNIDGSAQKIRQPFVASLSKWEIIEQAELHYVTAFLASRYGFGVMEPTELQAADNFYRRILDQMPRFRPPLLSAARRLQSTAREGSKRVQQARGLQPRYDLQWLYQPDAPSKNAKDPA